MDISRIQDIISEHVHPVGLDQCKAVYEASVEIYNRMSGLPVMAAKPFKEQHFKYTSDLVKFLNTNEVEIVAITAAGKYSEGYHLIYK